MTQGGGKHDESVIDADFQALLDRLGRLHGTPAERKALGMAARLVELAAFEGAHARDSATVSRLIQMAAELERIAAGNGAAVTRRH